MLTYVNFRTKLQILTESGMAVLQRQAIPHLVPFILPWFIPVVLCVKNIICTFHFLQQVITTWRAALTFNAGATVATSYVGSLNYEC